MLLDDKNKKKPHKLLNLRGLKDILGWLWIIPMRGIKLYI
jgi:hypothetical protein